MAEKSKFRTALEWFGLSKAFAGLISSGVAAVTTGGALYVFWQSLIVLPLLIQFFLSFGVFLFCLAFIGRGWRHFSEPDTPPSLNLSDRRETSKEAGKAKTTVNINLPNAVPREEYESLRKKVIHAEKYSPRILSEKTETHLVDGLKQIGVTEAEIYLDAMLDGSYSKPLATQLIKIFKNAGCSIKQDQLYRTPCPIGHHPNDLWLDAGEEVKDRVSKLLEQHGLSVSTKEQPKQAGTWVGIIVSVDIENNQEKKVRRRLNIQHTEAEAKTQWATVRAILTGVEWQTLVDLKGHGYLSFLRGSLQNKFDLQYLEFKATLDGKETKWDATEGTILEIPGEGKVVSIDCGQAPFDDSLKVEIRQMKDTDSQELWGAAQCKAVFS